ncbi:hypothetical protein [Streptococcus pneumoniae]|uniref:Uncharacterized protein n=1 Tax=Streptococcus pneumoniae (strain Hungary19A-6) TaxID=487214 RepID=B1IBU2_STRPI|nr:hypothetical protein [Streptococcus pneumoniae]ACA36181.1 hypothetical protein SPH_1254 [Streptococcus pneumoniae Hungary19A-6]ARD34772.1 hypothetical protein SPNHU17_01189 [Streptococcus pneumoniae]ARD36968.1 hypothetical protein SPNHU15_01188 [Streptococcus pneumoniae]
MENNHSEVQKDKLTIDKVPVQNNNLTEALRVFHETLNYSRLIEVQNSMLQANKAAEAALASFNFSKQIAETTKPFLTEINSATSILNNQRYLKILSETEAAFSSILLKTQIDSIGRILDPIHNIFDKSALNFTESLKEFLKEYHEPYSETEAETITLNIEKLAEEGWVIYHSYSDDYRTICTIDFEELIKEWQTLLKEDLEDKELIQELKDLTYYSEPLIDSMIESYRSQNYYAAYTLATIAIDGALNRFSEPFSNKKIIPVGKSSVDLLNKQIVNKTFTDISLFHWLFKFFSYTNNFTLEEPNRNMISHGRWERPLFETDFLKLFNVLLCILDNFEFFQGDLLK